VQAMQANGDFISIEMLLLIRDPEKDPTPKEKDTI